jgi:hypothetical protein
MDGVKANMSTPFSIHATIEEAQLYYIHGVVKPSEEYYDSYEVESDFEDHTISTKGKFLRDDIVVKKVPVSTVGNIAGGYTLNIGG